MPGEGVGAPAVAVVTEPLHYTPPERPEELRAPAVCMTIYPGMVDADWLRGEIGDRLFACGIACGAIRLITEGE